VDIGEPQPGIQVCPGLVRATRLAFASPAGNLGAGPEVHRLGSYGYNMFGAGPGPNGPNPGSSRLGLGGEWLKLGHVPPARRPGLP